MYDKIVTAQEHVDDILAQVVDVAFDRAQQDASRSLARNLALYYGLEQFHHLAKDLAGHDEPSQIVFVSLVAHAHLAHPLLTVFDDQQRVVASVQSLTDEGQGGLFLEIGDGGDQYGTCVCVAHVCSSPNRECLWWQ